MWEPWGPWGACLADLEPYVVLAPLSFQNSLQDLSASHAEGQEEEAQGVCVMEAFLVRQQPRAGVAGRATTASLPAGASGEEGSSPALHPHLLCSARPLSCVFSEMAVSESPPALTDPGGGQCGRADHSSGTGTTDSDCQTQVSRVGVLL